MIRSKARRSTIRSLTTGNEAARNGSTVISSPSAKDRMWSWQVAVARSGPWARPLIITPQVPQMPSRQSWAKVTGSVPSSSRRSLTMSSISRNEASAGMPRASTSWNPPGAPGPSWRQIRSLRSSVALTCSS